ncbi:hypothetical protein BN2475_140040 [Paraburkholderia ribeironis]|uniref:Uncharacterized protein n=1 Tax=Paraburkholderia ribeironis TaxID=1247936 RepID=A0A1N7RSR6_9BURK|nr:hypothetical protein BN2475_140040 [Paraburkholderia ribeironis]
MSTLIVLLPPRDPAVPSQEWQLPELPFVLLDKAGRTQRAGRSALALLARADTTVLTRWSSASIATIDTHAMMNRPASSRRSGSFSPAAPGRAKKALSTYGSSAMTMHKATVTQEAFDGVWVTSVNSRHAANRAVSCLR